MTIVVDCGQHSFKAGDIGDTPKVIRAQGSFRENLVDETFWRSIANITSITDTGRTGSGFEVDGHEVQLIVSLPISSLRSSREELCEFLFEKYLPNGKTSACILSSAFLATLGAGLSTALVIDIGEAETRVTPVEEGYPLPHCSAHGRIGGAALTSNMAEMLRLRDQSTVSTVSTAEVVSSAAESAKEESAWVAQDFNAELQRLKTASVSMASSGNGIQSLRERGFMCGEVLFDARSGDTLPELVMTSLRLQSNINLRGKLLSNMLLVGGTAQLPGLQTRLVSAVRAQSKWVAPGQPLDLVNVVNVVNFDKNFDKRPAVLPWVGGSLLAQCDAIKDLTITREAYDKFGPQVVHQTFL